MKPSILSKLESIEERHTEVSALLSDAQTIQDQDRYRQLSMEYAQLAPLVNSFRAWCKTVMILPPPGRC
jgi:peptide chain release factor 1